MNKDRGIIKWQPFNSFTDQKQLIYNLLQEKQKVKKPILSLEQQKEIEEKIIEAFYEQINIVLKVYKNEKIITINSRITSLDPVYKRLTLENNTTILFSQIIQIFL